MAAASEILRKIDQRHKVEARYSQSVQEHRDREVHAVVGYLEGRYKPLGEWAGRKYRSVILNDPGNTFVSFKVGNPNPVPSGRWMGQLKNIGASLERNTSNSLSKSALPSSVKNK
jgi:hypothetical protein